MVIRPLNQFDFNGNRHVIYLAENAGDVLAPGLHDHDYDHLCLPMSGRIEAFFDDRDPIAAEGGEPPFEFVAGRKHGIRAVTAGAIFMNVVAL
jgi:hypothetical protein